MTVHTRHFLKTCRSMSFALMVAFLSFGAISGCSNSNDDNDWFGAGDSDGSDGGLGAVDPNSGIYPNPQNIAPFVGDDPRKLQFWDLTYSWTDDPDGGTGTCTKGNVQIMNDELQVTQTAAVCPDNIGQVTPCNPQAGEDDQGSNVVASGAVQQSAKGCIRDGQGVANCSATPVSGPTDALTCQQAVEREDPLAAGAVWYQRLAGIPPGTSANYWWGKAFGAQGGEANTYGGTQMVYWGDSESAISVAASGGGEYSKEVQPIYMCNSATADVTNTDDCGLSSLFGTCLKDGQNCRINNLTEDADGFFNVYFKSAPADVGDTVPPEIGPDTLISQVLIVMDDIGTPKKPGTMSEITSDTDYNGIGVAGEFTPGQRKKYIDANYSVAQTCSLANGPKGQWITDTAYVQPTEKLRVTKILKDACAYSNEVPNATDFGHQNVTLVQDLAYFTPPVESYAQATVFLFAQSYMTNNMLTEKTIGVWPNLGENLLKSLNYDPGAFKEKVQAILPADAKNWDFRSPSFMQFLWDNKLVDGLVLQTYSGFAGKSNNPGSLEYYIEKFPLLHPEYTGPYITESSMESEYMPLPYPPKVVEYCHTPSTKPVPWKLAIYIPTGAPDPAATLKTFTTKEHCLGTNPPPGPTPPPTPPTPGGECSESFCKANSGASCTASPTNNCEYCNRKACHPYSSAADGMGAGF